MHARAHKITNTEPVRKKQSGKLMNKQQESNPSQAVKTSGRTDINERTTLGTLTEGAFVSKGRLFFSSVDDEERNSRDL